MRDSPSQNFSTRLLETSSRYAFDPRWSLIGVNVRSRMACTRSTAASFQGWPSTASAASVTQQRRGSDSAEREPGAAHAAGRVPIERHRGCHRADVVEPALRDLVEAYEFGQRARNLDCRQHLAPTQGGPAISREEGRERQCPSSARTSDVDRRVEGEQQWRGVADGRCRGKIAAERRPVPDGRRREEREPLTPDIGRAVPAALDVVKSEGLRQSALATTCRSTRAVPRSPRR